MQVGVANAAELNGDLDVVGTRLAALKHVGCERLIRGGGGIGFNLQGKSPEARSHNAQVTTPQAQGQD
jgi:hypothetical protein